MHHQHCLYWFTIAQNWSEFVHMHHQHCMHRFTITQNCKYVCTSELCMAIWMPRLMVCMRQPPPRADPISGSIRMATPWARWQPLQSLIPFPRFGCGCCRTWAGCPWGRGHRTRSSHWALAVLKQAPECWGNVSFCKLLLHFITCNLFSSPLFLQTDDCLGMEGFFFPPLAGPRPFNRVSSRRFWKRDTVSTVSTHPKTDLYAAETTRDIP